MMGLLSAPLTIERFNVCPVPTMIIEGNRRADLEDYILSLIVEGGGQVMGVDLLRFLKLTNRMPRGEVLYSLDGKKILYSPAELFRELGFFVSITVVTYSIHDQSLDLVISL